MAYSNICFISITFYLYQTIIPLVYHCHWCLEHLLRTFPNYLNFLFNNFYLILSCLMWSITYHNNIILSPITKFIFLLALNVFGHIQHSRTYICAVDFLFKLYRKIIKDKISILHIQSHKYLWNCHIHILAAPVFVALHLIHFPIIVNNLVKRSKTYPRDFHKLSILCSS